MSLAAKLASIASECAYVQKDARNTHFGYSYASACAVLGKVNEALARHKIATTVVPEILSTESVQTERGGVARLVTVRVAITLRDGESEETFTTYGLGSGQDSPGEKAVMKAQTAAIKYGWLLALSIATGDDPEADARTDEGGEQRRDEHPADAPNVRCPEDVLAELPASVTIDEAASVLVKHWPGLCAEDRIAAWREIIRRCPPKTSAAALKKACEAEHAWHAKRAAEAKAGSNEPPRNSSDAAPVTTPKAPPAAPTPANDAPAATAHDVATARLRVVLSTCIDVPGVCDVVVRSAREFHPLEEIEITKLGAERIQAITNCTPMQAVNRIRDAANQARGRKLRAVR